MTNPKLGDCYRQAYRELMDAPEGWTMMHGDMLSPLDRRPGGPYPNGHAVLFDTEGNLHDPAMNAKWPDGAWQHVYNFQSGARTFTREEAMREADKRDGVAGPWHETKTDYERFGKESALSLFKTHLPWVDLQGLTPRQSAFQRTHPKVRKQILDGLRGTSDYDDLAKIHKAQGLHDRARAQEGRPSPYTHPSQRQPWGNPSTHPQGTTMKLPVVPQTGALPVLAGVDEWWKVAGYNYDKDEYEYEIDHEDYPHVIDYPPSFNGHSSQPLYKLKSTHPEYSKGEPDKNETIAPGNEYFDGEYSEDEDSREKRDALEDIGHKVLAAIEQGDTQYGLGSGHTAPADDGYHVPFHNPEDMLPDVYEHPEYYVSSYDRRDPRVHRSGMENHRALLAARGNPDAPVKIYRAAPHGITEIEGHTNPAGASWVSASLSYAKRHAEAEYCPSCGGNMQVISGMAKASQLFNEGYLEEWGYTGDPIKDDSALAECPEGAYEARKAAEEKFRREAIKKTPGQQAAEDFLKSDDYWWKVDQGEHPEHRDTEQELPHYREDYDVVPGHDQATWGEHGHHQQDEDEPEDGEETDFEDSHDRPVDLGHIIDRASQEDIHGEDEQYLRDQLIHHGGYQLSSNGEYTKTDEQGNHHRVALPGDHRRHHTLTTSFYSPSTDEMITHTGHDNVDSVLDRADINEEYSKTKVEKPELDYRTHFLNWVRKNPQSYTGQKHNQFARYFGHSERQGTVGERASMRRTAAISEESGLKAAGIAVIAMDTGRVLMLQRALNPLTCPCGQGVTWDEMNGYQHDDGSVSHDDSDLSVSEMLDQGHDGSLEKESNWFEERKPAIKVPPLDLDPDGRYGDPASVHYHPDDEEDADPGWFRTVDPDHIDQSNPSGDPFMNLKGMNDKGLSFDSNPSEGSLCEDCYMYRGDHSPHPSEHFTIGNHKPMVAPRYAKTSAIEYDHNEGRWEFPGGCLDPGEPARTAAIREFREEVGQDLPPGVFVGAWLSPGAITATASVGTYLSVDPAYQKEFHDWADREISVTPEEIAAMSPEDQRDLADGFGHYIGEEDVRDARFHLDMGQAGRKKVRTGRPGTTVRVLRVEKPDGSGPFEYGKGLTPQPFEGSAPMDLDMYSLMNPDHEEDPDKAGTIQRMPDHDKIPDRYVRGRVFGFLPQQKLGDYFTPRMLQGMHERGYGMSEYDVPGEHVVIGRTQAAWRPEHATRVSHNPLVKQGNNPMNPVRMSAVGDWSELSPAARREAELEAQKVHPNRRVYAPETYPHGLVTWKDKELPITEQGMKNFLDQPMVGFRGSDGSPHNLDESSAAWESKESDPLCAKCWDERDKEVPQSKHFLHDDRHRFTPLLPEPGDRRFAAVKPVYKCFIYLVQSEKDIDLSLREIANPDDPDGDMSEQCAWWDIEHAKANPALRPEVKTGTPWEELELWADKSVRTNKEIKESFARLAAAQTPAQQAAQKWLDDNSGDFTHWHNSPDASTGRFDSQTGEEVTPESAQQDEWRHTNVRMQQAGFRYVTPSSATQRGFFYRDSPRVPGMGQRITEPTGWTPYWQVHQGPARGFGHSDFAVGMHQDLEDALANADHQGGAAGGQYDVETYVNGMLKRVRRPKAHYYDSGPAPITSVHEAIKETSKRHRKYAAADKCMYCESPSTKEIIHSEGIGCIPVCGEHLGKGETDAANCTPDGSHDSGNIDSIREASAQEPKRPKLPDSLKYVDKDIPYGIDEDDGEKTYFWRYQDPELVPIHDYENPLRCEPSSSPSHNRTVDWQPMIMLKNQSDYVDEDNFDRAPVGGFFSGSKTDVKWNEPVCEHCYMSKGVTIPEEHHSSIITKDHSNFHEFKPMKPVTDERGNFRESKVAAPLTQDVPQVKGILHSGEGALNRDVTLPSGDWIAKSPEDYHIHNKTLPADSREYAREQAGHLTDMEEFASRLGKALSNPADIPIVPEAVRGNKSSDATPTVYIRKHPDFIDMEKLNIPERSKHVDTPRGKVIGYFHSILGDGDKTFYHNMGVVGGQPVSIDHTYSSLPEYASAIADRDQSPDDVKRMRWHHANGEISPFEGHFMDFDSDENVIPKSTNPLASGDTARAVAASETMRPWAQQRGVEPWLNAAQNRMRFLGKRATGTESLFPYQMHHEGQQRTAGWGGPGGSPPGQAVFPAIRDVITAGKPEYSIRSADQVSSKHHDLISDSEKPTYHQENSTDPAHPSVYALRNNGGYTFLAPVTHNKTGEDGWIRGSTRTDPSKWHHYSDETADVLDATAGRAPQRMSGGRKTSPEGDVPLDEEGHQLLAPRKDTWAELGAERGFADEPELEGDVPLDEEGHQLVEPRRDYWVDPMGRHPWDFDWDKPGEHPLLEPESKRKLAWWVVPSF